MAIAHSDQHGSNFKSWIYSSSSTRAQQLWNPAKSKAQEWFSEIDSFCPGKRVSCTPLNILAVFDIINLVAPTKFLVIGGTRKRNQPFIRWILLALLGPELLAHFCPTRLVEYFILYAYPDFAAAETVFGTSLTCTSYQVVGSIFVWF